MSEPAWDGSALERRVMADGAFYVHRLDRDLDQGRLVFYLCRASEPPGQVVRRLIFSGVREFRELWDEEPDPDLLESIIGLHRRPMGSGFEYLIRLDQSEMYFWTAEAPQVEEAACPRSTEV